jgi:plastocyanin
MNGLIEVVSPSQTIHEVSVANFSFTPANLEIEEGDIVRWTNQEGTHNVNGTFETFPDNPMEFFTDVSADSWVYEFTFTEVGNYNYRCDVHPAQMEGAIMVSELTGIEDAPEQNDFYALFPNPVENQLNWRWKKDNVPAKSVLILYNSEGKQVDRFSMRNKSSRDMSALSRGLYQYVITSDNEEIQTGKLLIQR